MLEIGTEELPPHEIQSVIRQWKEAVPTLLKDLRLSHGEISISGTPRRLVVFVHELAARQAEQVVKARGPAADKAFIKKGTLCPQPSDLHSAPKVCPSTA